MRTEFLKLLSGTVIAAVTMAAHATTVSNDGCAGGNSGLTSCVAGATVVTFDSGSMPAGISNAGGSGGRIVSGSVSGQYAAPAGDSTDYLAIPTTTSSGTVEALLGGKYNYFGLYWGSIDSFNTLTFLDDGQVVGSFTGAQIISDTSLEGNQVAAGSNEYLNFYFGSQSYDTVLLSSTNYAFESDNLAFDSGVASPALSVSEPFTAGLLGVGILGALACSTRRRILA